MVCKDGKDLIHAKNGYSQIECQIRCETERKCVGISFIKPTSSHRPNFKGFCKICYSEQLIVSTTHPFKFYRRPGNYLYKNVRYLIVFFLILLYSEKVLSWTFSRSATCRCNALASLQGLFGRCKNFKDSNKKYCYVQQPTNCPDAKNAVSDNLQGEKYSEEACNGML